MVQNSLPHKSQAVNRGQVGIPSLELQSLHLIGFDPSLLLETQILPLLNLNNLQSLSLESCDEWGDIPTLPSTTTSSNITWIPRLQNFRVRREASNAMFQEHLKAFLSSFRGLVNLSILLNGPGPMLEPACFIKNHGSSLETLVWDQRSGPRREFGITITHFNIECTHRSLSEISHGCPNLRELGIACFAKEHDYPYTVGYLTVSFPLLCQL